MEESKNEQVKSKKDSFMERLRERHPDNQFADDEEVYGAISGDYDDYDNKIKDYDRMKSDERKLLGLFDEDPRNAGMWGDLVEGKDISVSFVRRYGPELVDAVNDPEKQEELEAASKEYRERIAKSKKLDKEAEKNLGETIDMVDEKIKQYNLTDEQADEVIAKILQISSDGIVNKITPETFDLVYNAVNHDKDVETAAHEAEVRGRNANIEERLKKAKKGDGMPSAPSGRAVLPKLPKRNLGALDRASEASSIWDQGKFNLKQ